MNSASKRKRTGNGFDHIEGRTEIDPRDAKLCREVQNALLPQSLPVLEEVDLVSLYLPARRIGGDLFDVIHISEDLVGFYIFDVTGQGVASTLLSAMAKVSFSNHMRTVASPRAVLERVNSDVRRISADTYITAFVGFLDLHNNKFTFCGAGHPPPFVYRRREDQLQALSFGGVFLGVLENPSYADEKVFLNTGDWVIMYTNGLYALFSPTTPAAIQNAFHQAIAAMPRRSVDELPDLLQARYRRETREVSMDDDISVLAFEMLGQSRKNQLKVKLGFSEDEPVYLQWISYYEEMESAAGAVLKDMDASGFPDESIRKMKITLTELMANAIGHGNREDHSKRAVIGHVIDRRKVRVGILDEGTGFDPDAVPDPTLPENLAKDHGRGLFIVRNYVDSMEFNETGNRVLIRKSNG